MPLPGIHSGWGLATGVGVYRRHGGVNFANWIRRRRCPGADYLRYQMLMQKDVGNQARSSGSTPLLPAV
jgi:hypothetical protein